MICLVYTFNIGQLSKPTCKQTKDLFEGSSCCDNEANTVSGLFVAEDAQLKTMDSSKTVGTTLVIGPNGEVKCSGDNSHGQCGFNADAYPSFGFATPHTMNGYPALETHGKKAIEVATGSTFSAVLLEDHTVQSFGTNNPFPSGLNDMRSVCAGSDHAGVLTNAKKLSIHSLSGPHIHLSDVTHMSCGCHHVLALTSDGSVFAYGSNSHGQAGHAGAANSEFVKINGLPPARFVAAGCENSGIITQSGDIHTWGRNDFGQLGHNYDDYLFVGTHVNGVNVPFGSATKVARLPNSEVKWLSMGPYHTLITFENGFVHGIGLNSHGETLGRSGTAKTHYSMYTNHPYICKHYNQCGKSNAESDFIPEGDVLYMRNLVHNTHFEKATKSAIVSNKRVTLNVHVTCGVSKFITGAAKPGDIFNWTRQGDTPVRPGKMHLLDPISGDVIVEQDMGEFTRDQLHDITEWIQSGTSFNGRDMNKWPPQEFPKYTKPITLTVPTDTPFKFHFPTLNEPGGGHSCFLRDGGLSTRRTPQAELETELLLSGPYNAMNTANRDGSPIITWFERGGTDSYYFTGEEGELAHFHYYSKLATEEVGYVPYYGDPLDAGKVNVWYHQIRDYYAQPKKQMSVVTMAVAGYKSTYTRDTKERIIFSGTNEPHNQHLYIGDAGGVGEVKKHLSYLWPHTDTNDWSQIPSDELNVMYGEFDWYEQIAPTKMPMEFMRASKSSAKNMVVVDGKWDGNHKADYFYDNFISNGWFASGASFYGCTIKVGYAYLPCDMSHNGYGGNYTHPSPTEMFCLDGGPAWGPSQCQYIYGQVNAHITLPMGFEKFYGYDYLNSGPLRHMRHTEIYPSAWFPDVTPVSVRAVVSFRDAEGNPRNPTQGEVDTILNYVEIVRQKGTLESISATVSLTSPEFVETFVAPTVSAYTQAILEIAENRIANAMSLGDAYVRPAYVLTSYTVSGVSSETLCKAENTPWTRLTDTQKQSWTAAFTSTPLNEGVWNSMFSTLHSLHANAIAQGDATKVIYSSLQESTN